jgi:Pre-toxin TG
MGTGDRRAAEMNRPLRTLARAAAVLAAVLALVEPAAADNCGTPSDCFGSAGSFNLAALGLLLLASLSLLLDVLPVVGTAKGVAEAVTGRDLLTGQELSWWERALGVVPVVGGVAAIAGIARVGRGLDAAGDIAGMGRHVDDTGTLGRQADGAPALRETGGRTPEQWDEVLSRVDPDSARAWELRDRYAEDYYEIVGAAGDAQIDEVARSSGHDARRDPADPRPPVPGGASAPGPRRTLRRRPGHRRRLAAAPGREPAPVRPRPAASRALRVALHAAPPRSHLRSGAPGHP